jgi:hypothetical protein
MECPNCKKPISNSEVCYNCGFNLVYVEEITPYWLREFKKWEKHTSQWGIWFIFFILFSGFLIILLLIFGNIITWIFYFVLALFLFSGLGYSGNKMEVARSNLLAELQRFEDEQTTKGLVKFVSALNHVRWGSPEEVKEWKILDMDMRNNFAGLTPRQFEKLVAELFAQMGYETTLTPKTADYGVDVIAKKNEDTIAIQVKKYSKGRKVGNRDIQRLLGSMYQCNANKAIFVTSSEFTTPAYLQASKAPAELWNYETLCQIIERYILKM